MYHIYIYIYVYINIDTSNPFRSTDNIHLFPFRSIPIQYSLANPESLFMVLMLALPWLVKYHGNLQVFSSGVKIIDIVIHVIICERTNIRCSSYSVTSVPRQPPNYTGPNSACGFFPTPDPVDPQLNQVSAQRDQRPVLTMDIDMGGFHSHGEPPFSAGWLIWKILLEMDDLGVSLFLEIGGC